MIYIIYLGNSNLFWRCCCMSCFDRPSLLCVMTTNAKFVRRLVPLMVSHIILLCHSSVTCAQTPSQPQLATAPVFLFIVHGFDPCDAARLHQLRQVAVAMGYTEATVYQCYQTHSLIQHVVAVKQAYPQARLVFTGFSLGTLSVRTATHALHDEYGIDVDALIYLGGWFLSDRPESQPPYVPHVTHVLGQYFDFFVGRSLSQADNLVYACTTHFGVAMHPSTWTKLESELIHFRSLPVPAATPHATMQPTQWPSAPASLIWLGKPEPSAYQLCITKGSP